MTRNIITKEVTGLTPKQIINAITDVGLNQSAIARAIGVTPQTLGSVIHGKCVSRAIHKAIAKAIKMDVKQIWPQHYLHGEPKPGRKMVIWHQDAAA